jgi:hypothetical protein
MRVVLATVSSTSLSLFFLGPSLSMEKIAEGEGKGGGMAMGCSAMETLSAKGLDGVAP